MDLLRIRNIHRPGSDVACCLSSRMLSLSARDATMSTSQQLVYRSVMLLKYHPHIMVYRPGINIPDHNVSAHIIAYRPGINIPDHNVSAHIIAYRPGINIPDHNVSAHIMVYRPGINIPDHNVSAHIIAYRPGINIQIIMQHITRCC